MTENFINKLSLVRLSKSKMVQALVEIDENTNRVLNTVKAKFNLKDKGEAIEFVVSSYIKEKDDPELRPEFIEKMKRIQKQGAIHIGTMKDFDKYFGLK